MDLGQPELARMAYEAAVEANPNADRAVLELDLILQELNIPNLERLAMLESHREAVDGSDPLSGRLVSLYMQLGRYEDVLSVLTTHRFHSWEGRYGIHRYWIQCRIKLGDMAFEQGNYEEALGHYVQAMEYPDNLEAREQPGTIHARKRFKIGRTLSALGKKRDARAMFELVLTDNPPHGNPYSYYQGLALQELGKHNLAREKFQRMLYELNQEPDHPESGPQSHDNEDGGTEIRKALLHFTRALALKGLGKTSDAAREMESALELNPEVELRSFAPPAAGW